MRLPRPSDPSAAWTPDGPRSRGRRHQSVTSTPRHRRRRCAGGAGGAQEETRYARRDGPVTLAVTDSSPAAHRLATHTSEPLAHAHAVEFAVIAHQHTETN